MVPKTSFISPKATRRSRGDAAWGLRAMWPALVSGGPQQTPQKPLLWAPHPRLGCRGLLAAAPPQTPIRGVCRVPGDRCVHQQRGSATGWYRQENPLNSSQVSFFPPLLRGSGAAAPRWGGGPAGTPSAGKPRGSSVGPSPCYSAETRSWMGQKGNWCKEMHFLVPPAHYPATEPEPQQLNRGRSDGGGCDGAHPWASGSRAGGADGAEPGSGGTQRCHLFRRWPGRPRGSRGGRGGRTRLPFVPLPLQ